MPRALTRSILTCLCMVGVCATTTLAEDARTVVINIHGLHGDASVDSSVIVSTIDGQMTPATVSGTVYAVKNVGEKATIEVKHPQYGVVTFDAELAMSDPVFVEIYFTGQDRAYLVVPEVVADLAAQQAAPEGGGNGCASCMPIGDGIFVGSTCDNGSEPDITSCTFSDTVTAWFCYTASCDGTATAATCGSGYDTALSAWDACGGTQLACNDDFCGLQSSISWGVTAGTTYFIRLSGFADSCGSFILDVSCSGGGGGGCDLECPAGALDEGEVCGTDTNGGCNTVPPIFTDAQCGDTFCGTAWAAGDRDTDWYLVNHGGGILSSTLTSQFQGVNFIVDIGFPGCAPAVVGQIGCSNDCSPTLDASADLPAGTYVVFVATGNCDGSGIFDGVPCGSGNNDYTLSISCEGLVTGACCLPDNTCVDGLTQSECEDPPPSGDCGDCDQPDPAGAPGCSDPVCEAIVCAIDPFCCATAWDGICAGEAEDFCDCGGGAGGLGGVYQGDDTVCPGPTCIPVGGCCQCDGEDQFCTIESEDDCETLGGNYLGDGEACEAGGGDQVTVSSNPNAPIPDDNVFGVSDTINMGTSFTILDLEVSVNVTHTWVGDICVHLSKDGGPEVTLIQRMNDASLGCGGGTCCGCSADNFNVTLDDEAASPIGAQCVAGLTGTFIPENPLAGFLGGDSAAAWTIRANDNAGLDTGTLVSWSLTFTQPAAGGSPCEEAFPDKCVTAIEGNIDIKPGSCPNSFNRNSNGVLPVALVGSDEIDAGNVDLSSLALSRADGVGGSAAPHEGPPGPHTTIGDSATAFGGELCDCHELEGDGIDDLNMKFKSQEVVDALQLDDLPSGALVELVLTGSLLDGTEFSASDCIRLVPPGTPPGVLLVGSNVPGVWVDISPIDDLLDEGGFTSFNRAYPQTTVVTVSAPLVPFGNPNWILISIWVDGMQFAPGDGTIEVIIDGDMNSVALQYRQMPFNPNPGRGIQPAGGSSAQGTN